MWMQAGVGVVLTAVEQLDALMGKKSRTDVGGRTLRPNADPLGHWNKGDRTINKPRELIKITERMGTALGPQDLFQRPSGSSSETSGQPKKYLQVSEPCLPPGQPRSLLARGREKSGRD